VVFACSSNAHWAEQIGLLDGASARATLRMMNFCLRAALQGYKNYVAGDVLSIILEEAGASSATKSITAQTHLRNRKIIDKKWTLSARSPAGKKLSILRTTETAPSDLCQKGKHRDRAVSALINCIKLNAGGERNLL